MKEYLRHLLNAEDRPLLIRLTFGPCDVTTLAQISGLSPAQTAVRLQALKEIDLVSNTDAEEEFSLAPAIRKKINRLAVRLSITFSFFLVGSLLKGLDKQFFKRQTRRIHKAVPTHMK